MITEHPQPAASLTDASLRALVVDLAPLARLDAAKVDRDRVARMLEDGVDAARALRTEREATKGSANAR